MFIYTYSYICVYKYIYIYMYMYICIYINIYIHISIYQDFVSVTPNHYYYINPNIIPKIHIHNTHTHTYILVYKYIYSGHSCVFKFIDAVTGN